jgi:ABC-2 type transport system ATP-binding protein
VLSSHLVSDLERVCDYLIVLVASRVQAAGQVGELLAAHRRLAGNQASLEDLVLHHMSGAADPAVEAHQ